MTTRTLTLTKYSTVIAAPTIDAPRHVNLRRNLVHRWDLIGVMARMGSSAAYAVYGAGRMRRLSAEPLYKNLGLCYHARMFTFRRQTQIMEMESNRRLTRLDYYLGITLLGGVLLLGDWGIHHAQAGTMPPAIISAREFDVVDAAGRVEAKLRSRTKDDAGTLEVRDDQGRERVAVKAPADLGTAIILYGPDKTSRLSINALDDSDETNAIELNKDDKPLLVMDSTRGQDAISFTRLDGSTKLINGQ